MAGINNFVPNNVAHKCLKREMEGKKMIYLKRFVSIFFGFYFSTASSEEKPKIHMLHDRFFY